MNDLEKIILEEISSLDEMRLIDVIGFIRYLKSTKPIKQEYIAGWFESALEEIRSKEGLGVSPTPLKGNDKNKS